jgi:hypothetical protein
MRRSPTDANILDRDSFPTEKGPPRALFEIRRETGRIRMADTGAAQIAQRRQQGGIGDVNKNSETPPAAPPRAGAHPRQRRGLSRGTASPVRTGDL